MYKKIFLLIAAGAVLLLTGCSAGPNTVMDIASPSGDLSGFFAGLWHGMISPITFIISLFADSVSMYEVHNNGSWYDFGFVLGSGVLFKGISISLKVK